MTIPIHGDARATEVTAHPDIGGKPASRKHQGVVAVHSGMTERQQSGGAMGHATSAAPLDDEKLNANPCGPGKTFPIPKAANKGAS
jgi:hypothetical protein